MARIAAVDYRGSACDGPGMRTVVYFQGCPVHCEGCHNPGTWDPAGGTEVPDEELIEHIIERSPTRRITISGGEPLMQAHSVEQIARALKAHGYELALYTSFDRDSVPEGIAHEIDYLKTGPYVSSLRTTTTPYVGSTNQVFERMTA